MKIGDIKNIKIARKYANALFEAAVDASLLDKVSKDIIFVVEKGLKTLVDLKYKKQAHDSQESCACFLFQYNITFIQ